MSWQHGYHTETPYTCGFYRELAPDWLDFAVLLRGQPSPRCRAGEAFRYLELGSGMGLGLCLLAAAYPEGRFVGIDFKPDHILHSRRLAEALRLSNVTFREGDFLSLAGDPDDLHGQHDYVVAHGIITWITEPVQQALLALAAVALKPGGLFYCSYNTFPGWLATVPLQQLAWDLARTGLSAKEAVTRAAATLTELLGSEEEPAALGRALPGMRSRLAQLPNLDPAYLVQEYINEGWQPLSVAVLHERAAAHKLQYAASASLVENFEVLLADNVRQTVLAETDPGRRQQLFDLAIFQTFRRDVLVRGRLALTAADQKRALGELSLRLREAPALEAYAFPTSLGTITGRRELYQELERCLAAGPQQFKALQTQLALDLPGMARGVALLLDAGRLALDRGAAGEAALEGALRVNSTLRELQRQGSPYSFQVAPRAGTAVAFGLVESLLLHDPDPARLPEALAALGQQLTSDANTATETFQARLPWLQALGVVAEAGAAEISP